MNQEVWRKYGLFFRNGILAYRVRARDARIRVMHAEHQISVLTLPLQPPLALLI
jgi:hypothetical protein